MSVRWISLLIGTLVGIAAMTGDAAAVDSFFTAPSQTAKVMKVPLVTAFEPCRAPGSWYDSELTARSCIPPVQNADIKWGPKGTGSISLALTRHKCRDFNGNGCIDVVDPRPDIVVTAKLTDIRTLAGSPYSGPLGGGTTYLRITSTDNYPPVSGDRSGTTANTAFPIQDPPGQDCSAGKCTIVTSFLTTVPGMLEDGKRSNIEFGVPNNSSSGQSFIDASNGEHFATPGIFLQ